MFPGELKDSLIEGAVAISTALILTRVIVVEFVHVVDCCKECYQRVSPTREGTRKLAVGRPRPHR